MKKTLLSITIFLATIHSAIAGNYYVGAEATFNQLGYKEVSSVRLSNGQSFKINTNDYYDNKNLGYGGFAGYQFDAFDIELGYNHLSTSKSNNSTGLVVNPGNHPLTTKGDVKLDMISLDIKPVAKLTENFSLMPFIGVTVARASFDENFMSSGSPLLKNSESKTKVGFDLGIGARYQVTRSLFTRVQFKYTRLDMNTDKTLGVVGLDYVASASVGAGYSF